ncbi:gliding motility-associated ABC transporter substrate-binding protein GldG [Aureisphaera galaxeae]|uniref:gliding motility-associated ABC transporter substrate-binding protein GldG n=1 Tax=Aureisphaera galaxeae TaxID=1538023 RepID=UPI002350DD89|nr:gliding motility-associated ABC transporter substrate-binding protein GldG [Aureisphaera galaxeae]MDC8004540.1 gliding motility-associated ABC transporter substrate-binding protein GldG [Aureisphaera galaxeae]
MSKQKITILLGTLIGIILVNWLSGMIYKRFDLTQDQRYTLSEAATTIIDGVDSPISIDIFLDGRLPSEFKRLRVETQQLLEEFSAYNSNVRYQFVNPLDEGVDRNAMQQIMMQFGIKGANVQIQENGKTTNEVVYPWALAYYNDKTIAIPLLKNQLGATSEERINGSIQNLEYAFADGFSKLTLPKRRKVAVLKGNQELPDRYLADFITTLREYYFIGQFTLDSVAVSPQRTLQSLNDYDLVIAAQPQETFSEEEKYVLDQYTMNGGASLWLVDPTFQQLDTISGNTFTVPQDLGLNDFFFKYGVRVNPDLVKDIYAAPITLASGEGNESQYQPYPWLYHPLSASANNHPITTNIEAVKFEYASSIDTLPNLVKKTVLLSTSPISKIVGLPAEIDIDKEIPKNLKIVNEGPNPEEFNAGEVPLAVLLEGEFPSIYANRIKPFALQNAMEKSVPTKMVVISDGDVIRNQLDRGRPLELGFDKWTNSFYGNKEFLLNTVNYLLDDSGLINIRTKQIAIPFLDPQKTAQKRTQWQLVNLLLPLGLLGIFGIFFQWYRRRKYRR